MVWFGKACTVAGFGRARFCTDRWGKVWQGVHRGKAWSGAAGQGRARRGKAWFFTNRRGINGKNSEDSKE